MTTAGPATTASVQDVQIPSPGQPGAAAHGAVPGLGNVTATSVTVAPSATQELLVVVRGLSLATATPAAVLVQPRQSDNQNNGYTDAYAVQVVSTSKTEIQVLVRRLDQDNGWGQSLRLDFLIVG